MESLRQLLKKENMEQNILALLFIVFLAMGKPIPQELSRLIETPLGTIVTICFSLFLFAYSNPILAILGVFVAFEIIRRSGSLEHNFYRPTEAKKWESVKASNEVQYTLEQEIVRNMAPTVQPDMLGPESSFKPIFDYTHDAAFLI
jgi:hypothetical protein